MTEKKHPMRLLTDTADLESTRVRGMDEVAREARAREITAVRNNRVADAAMYREIAERAEHVAAQERTLRRTLTEDETIRERLKLERTGRTDKRLGLGLTIMAIGASAALFFLTTGCAGAPPVRGPAAGTLEVYTGAAIPSGRGSNDVGDLGAYPIVGIGGALGAQDGLTGAAGEWFLEGGSAAGEVDAGALGLFDLEADVLRAGLGLRLGTRRFLGLDWGLGLGACLTIIHGTASAGPSLTADVDESGLGFYSAGTVSRGPFFLRTTYVAGPEVEVQDEGVELGGLSVAGGLRWTF